jgi:CpeT protein
MKMFKINQLKRVALFTGLLLSLYACTSSKKSASGSKDLDRLVSLMQGSFNSSAQAQRDTNYFDISLEMFPIWEKRKDARWLYVEQAVTAMKGKPYRQRVYRVTERPDGSFSSEVYTLPDEASFIGAYNTPEKFASLTPEQLVLRDGCAVILHREGDAFKGATEGNGCESSLRGAKYASSKVEIGEGHIHSWDQGFDANGKQVWGATLGGYEFVRQK